VTEHIPRNAEFWEAAAKSTETLTCRKYEWPVGTPQYEKWKRYY
jgi:hypothetical protein